MRTGQRSLTIIVAFVVSLTAPFARPALAQSTTSSIQGTISDDTGILPGASITARDLNSGFTYEATSDGSGNYTLSGLRPGTYDITVKLDKYKPEAKRVELLVGQTLTVNLRVKPDVVYTEDVQVVGSSRLVETRTSEIGTNVTKEEVRFLPQDQRNFLNFAALAQGARVSNDETRKQVTAGGLDATQINVFIDGVSYKNDMNDGGVVGQDSSRGSPFPQSAVQEFEVLTQNYKAEHEKASSAIITAVTKSGGNTWSGDAFLFYQNKALVSQEYFAKKRGDPKPTFDRFQPGFSIGGPIIKDKLHVFGSYEENRQNRDNRVFLGGTPFPPSLNLQQYEGTFLSPFREHLTFVKGTAQPAPGQTVDLSFSNRTESDIRSFGGQTAYTAAENVHNKVSSVLGRWQVPTTKWLNEASLTFQRAQWEPMPQDTTDVGLDYQGIIRAGGRDTTQNFIQYRTSLRDDLSHYAIWKGAHTMKGGVVLSFLRYDVSKELFGNPVFSFRSDNAFAFPFQAQYGVGNPDLSTSNREFGFYVQDDWTASKRLTVNLGVRWDYESDMLNNNYVTPQNVRQAAASFVDPTQYFTNGSSDRPPFYGAWQPRVGLSYDLTGKARDIVFGGYGRYYDRIFYNAGLDEKYRLQYGVRTFRFSSDGSLQDGFPTIIWQPSYLSKAGLDQLIASGVAPAPDIFLVNNNTKPPVSDQFNAGFRTSARSVLFTVNYAGIRARNGFTFLFANRNPNGSCCQAVPGFGNILMSSDAKKNWFDALYLSAERPLTGKWGFRFNYTLGRADAIGGDLFSLDYPTVEAYPRHPAPTDERNRIVATGLFRLPANFVASTLITLASGLGYTISDNTRGFGPNLSRVLLYEGRPDQKLAYRSVDARIEKLFTIVGRQQASIALEGFNIFNFTNFGCYDGFEPPLPEVNPNFGTPSCTVDNSTRRLQLGFRYTF